MEEGENDNLLVIAAAIAERLSRSIFPKRNVQSTEKALRSRCDLSTLTSVYNRFVIHRNAG